MSPKAIDALRDKLDTAEQHLEKSEFVQAEELANEVLSATNGNVTLSKDDEARALCILGVCCSGTARYEDALTHFHHALADAEASANLSLQSSALNGMAIVQGRRGEHNAALDTGKRALALAERVEDKEQHARALNNMGNAHTGLADYSLAVDYYSQSLVLQEEIGYTITSARTLTNIGASHYYLGDYPLALDFHGRALALAEEYGNRDLVALIFNSIGNAHRAIGDYPGALDCYTRTIEIAEEVGNKRLVASTLSNIGKIHADLSDYARSSDYTARSLTIAEQIGAKDIMVSNLTTIGFHCFDRGDYPRAVEYFKHAMKLGEEIGSLVHAADWINGIAHAELRMGHLEAAYLGFMDSLRHRREVSKSNEGVAETLVELGLTLFEQGKSEEGMVRLEEALAVSEELGEKRVTARARKELADAYARKADMANAYLHITEHYAIEKELYSAESKKRIEAFNMRVAIAEEGREAAVQRLRAERSERETEVQQLRAEQSEQKLSLQATALAGQTELLSHFREELRQITREVDEPIAALRKIKEKLKDLPCESIDWLKFEKEFASVHPEFRKLLKGRFPSLTAQEARLCLLLRVGMKSHEAARLMCISERGVESHRANIRRKLELKKEQSLTEFLAAAALR